MLYLIVATLERVYGIRVRSENLASKLTELSPTSILPDLFPQYPVTRI